MADDGRIKLHHSYLWLGILRALPAILIALITTSSAGLAELARLIATEGNVAMFFVVAMLFVALLVLIVGIGVAVLYASYRHIWYEFGESEFSYCSGIFSKKRVHVPYQKVQSVNEKASLLQRLAGVCTVTIETAGGASNKAVVVPYVTRSAAERIRRELFGRKRLMASGLSPAEAAAQMAAFVAAAEAQAASAAPTAPWELEAQAQMPGQPTASQTAPQAVPQTPGPQVPGPAGNVLDVPAEAFDDLRGIFAGAEEDTGEVTYEYGLSNKELLLAAVTGKSSVAVALIGIVAAAWSLFSMLLDTSFMPDDLSFYASMWDMMGGAGVGVWFELVSGLVMVLLIVWGACVIAAWLSFGGFRARRRGTRIEVERGIVSHLFSGIDVERIQSVVIHQSLFQRALGCCSVAYGRIGAQAASESDSSAATEAQQALVVHPFLPLDRVQEVVSQLTPEYADLPVADRRVSPKALRRGIVRRAVWQGAGFWLAIGSALVIPLAIPTLFGPLPPTADFVLRIVFASLLALALALFVVEVVGAVLWYRRAAFGFDRRHLTVVNGGYSVETVVMPRSKIQLASTRTNPLQRHAGVATIIAVSAAGVGGKRERLIDVSETDAGEWLAWVYPRGGSKV